MGLDETALSEGSVTVVGEDQVIVEIDAANLRGSAYGGSLRLLSTQSVGMLKIHGS